MNYLLKLLFLLFFTIALASNSYCQVNQTDSLGRKQGVWIQYLDKNNKLPNLYYFNPDSIYIYKYQLIFDDDSSHVTIENAKITENYVDGLKQGSFYIHFNDSMLFASGEYKNNILDGMIQIFNLDDNGIMKCAAICSLKEGKKNGIRIVIQNKKSFVTRYNTEKETLDHFGYFNNGDVAILFYNNHLNNRRFIHIDKEKQNTFLIFYKNKKRAYENGKCVYIRKESDGYHSYDLKISLMDRIFDKNILFMLLKRKEINKKYGLDLKIVL